MTVIVEVVLPLAATLVRLAETVDLAAVGVPAVNVMAAVGVRVTESVVSFAVNTAFPAVVDLAVKVATPPVFVVPKTVVTVSVPFLLEVRVTVLPGTTMPAGFFSVTVIVEVVVPLAVTLAGLADTVETVAEGGPTTNVTVAV